MYNVFKKKHNKQINIQYIVKKNEDILKHKNIRRQVSFSVFSSVQQRVTSDWFSTPWNRRLINHGKLCPTLMKNSLSRPTFQEKLDFKAWSTNTVPERVVSMRVFFFLGGVRIVREEQ